MNIGARDCVLAGERGGIRLPGFDVGNSPLDFSHELVSGKNVIFCTTNGTQAICGMSGAANLLIGAMINRTAVARRAVELGQDIVIMCAGTDGRFSADDIALPAPLSMPSTHLLVAYRQMTAALCLIFFIVTGSKTVSISTQRSTAQD